LLEGISGSNRVRGRKELSILDGKELNINELLLKRPGGIGDLLLLRFKEALIAWLSGVALGIPGSTEDPFVILTFSSLPLTLRRFY
jgi:hypothetical protein